MDQLIEYARKFEIESSTNAANSLRDRVYDIAKNYKKYSGSIDTILNDVSLVSTIPLLCVYLLHQKYQHHIDIRVYVQEVVDETLNVCMYIQVDKIQYATKELTYIIRNFTKMLLYGEKYMKGLLHIKILIEKMTIAYPNILTGVHVDLLLLTLKCHAYDLLLASLPNSYVIRTQSQQQISSTSSSSSSPSSSSSSSHPSYLSNISTFTHTLNTNIWSIDLQDYLSYWYYLGMAYCALKLYDKAQEAFQMTLIVPTIQVSAIQVAAYKKLVIVSILQHGELPVLNARLISNSVQRVLDTLCCHYIELSKYYKQSTITNLMNAMSHNIQEYQKDGNFGLIKQLLKKYSQKEIMKLTQTYITLNLQDIANQSKNTNVNVNAAIKQAEHTIFQMICSNDIFAKIDQKASMVAFLENPEDYNSSECAALLDEKIKQVIQLSSHLQTLDSALSLDQKYLLKLTPQYNKDMNNNDPNSLQSRISSHLQFDNMGGGGGLYDNNMDDDDPQLRAAIEQSLMQQ